MGDRLSLSFMGLAFARAWLAVLFADPLSVGYASSYGNALFDVSYAGCALAVLVLIRRLVPVTAPRFSWVLPLVLMELSSFMFIFGQVGVLSSDVSYVLSSVSGGVGFLLFCLYNAEVMVTQPLRNVMMYLALSPVLGYILTFFLVDVRLEKAAVALVLLPVIAIALCVDGLRKVPERYKPANTWPRFAVPWVLIVLLSLYSFVYGLHQSELAPGVGRYSSAVNAVVGLAMAVWVAFLSSRVSFKILYGAPAVLIVCGFVLMSIQGFAASMAADVLISGAFGLAVLVVSFMFYDMSKRTGAPIVMFSAAYAATNIFGIAGQVASRLMEDFPAHGSIVAAITYVSIAALLLLIGYATLADRTLFERWGIRLAEDDAAAILREDEKIERRCKEFADANGLTSRELEVLTLVVRGLSSREVQDRLFIAEGTFKTHMRHIYEKSGVRGQKRLRQVLGEQAEESF